MLNGRIYYTENLIFNSNMQKITISFKDNQPTARKIICQLPKGLGSVEIDNITLEKSFYEVL